MFKNRFTLIVTVLFALFVSLAVARPFAGAPAAAHVERLPGAVIVPVTGASESPTSLQRLPDPGASAGDVDLSDYFARHPESLVGAGSPPGGAVKRAPLDECFDVSLGEVAACRAASESVSR